MQMFESGLGAVPEADTRGVQVFDLAELLEMSVVMSQPMATHTVDAPTPATAPATGAPAAIEEQAAAAEAENVPPPVTDSGAPPPGPVDHVAAPETPTVSDEDVASGETPTV